MLPDNKDCRVVKVGDCSILALSRDPKYSSLHKPIVDALGKSKERRCCLSTCKKVFVANKTMLNPGVIVGPAFHPKLGSKPWVCQEHWMRSVQDEQDGDKTCEVAMLDMECSTLLDEPGSPVIGGQPCLKGIKRKLVFATTPEEKRGKIATYASGSGPKKASPLPRRKRGPKGPLAASLSTDPGCSNSQQDSSDMFLDSAGLDTRIIDDASDDGGMNK